MARPVFAALLAALVLGGCLAGPSDQADVARTYAWGIDGCRFVIAVIPVDASVARGFLPPGFTPRASTLASAPGAPGAEVHADAYDCSGGTALDGSRIDGVRYGSFYVPVDPPEDLREEGYGAYFVKLGFLAWDPAALSTLQDGGLPAFSGSAAVASDGNQVDAVLDLEGGSGFRLQGAFGPATSQDGALPFLEHTPLADGGLAVWHARLHDASFATGTGVLTLNGPMAAALGGTPKLVQFSTGTWNLDEADVTFPVEWPR